MLTWMYWEYDSVCFSSDAGWPQRIWDGEGASQKCSGYQLSLMMQRLQRQFVRGVSLPCRIGNQTRVGVAGQTATARRSDSKNFLQDHLKWHRQTELTRQSALHKQTPFLLIILLPCLIPFYTENLEPARHPQQRRTNKQVKQKLHQKHGKYELCIGLWIVPICDPHVRLSYFCASLFDKSGHKRSEKQLGNWQRHSGLSALFHDAQSH